MTELIIDILTKLKQHGVMVDENKAKFALEVALDGYEITKNYIFFTAIIYYPPISLVG